MIFLARFSTKVPLLPVPASRPLLPAASDKTAKIAETRWNPDQPHAASRAYDDKPITLSFVSHPHISFSEEKRYDED